MRKWFASVVLSFSFVGAAFAGDAPSKITLWTGGPLPDFIQADLVAGTIAGSPATAANKALRVLTLAEQKDLINAAQQVLRNGVFKPPEERHEPGSNIYELVPAPCGSIDSVAKITITIADTPKEFSFGFGCANSDATQLVRLLRCDAYGICY